MSFAPPEFSEDPANPYAPPQAEIGRRLFESFSTVSIPFTVGDVLSYSYRLFKLRMGICMAATWAPTGLIWLMQIGVAVIPVIFQAGGMANLGFVVQMITNILAAVAQWWLTLGQMLVLMKVAQGRPVEFGEIFLGGRYLLRAILAGLLIGLSIGGVAVLCLAPFFVLSVTNGMNTGGANAALAIGVICLAVACLLISARVSQVFYVMFDRDARAVEALQISNALTRGKEGTIIVLWFLAGLIVIAGILALCVGFVFAVPLCGLMAAVTYVSLAGRPKSGPLDDRDPFPPSKSPFDPDFSGVV